MKVYGLEHCPVDGLLEAATGAEDLLDSNVIFNLVAYRTPLIDCAPQFY
jgi:hypothetical protein